MANGRRASSSTWCSGATEPLSTVAPSHDERLEEAVNDGSEKPKAMLELPDVVFRLVCRFLE